MYPELPIADTLAESDSWHLMLGHTTQLQSAVCAVRGEGRKSPHVRLDPSRLLLCAAIEVQGQIAGGQVGASPLCIASCVGECPRRASGSPIAQRHEYQDGSQGRDGRSACGCALTRHF